MNPYLVTATQVLERIDATPPAERPSEIAIVYYDPEAWQALQIGPATGLPLHRKAMDETAAAIARRGIQVCGKTIGLDQYRAWLASTGRPDSQDARATWAASGSDYRLSLVIRSNVIGWAIVGLAADEVVDRDVIARWRGDPEPLTPQQPPPLSTVLAYLRSR